MDRSVLAAIGLALSPALASAEQPQCAAPDYCPPQCARPASPAPAGPAPAQNFVRAPGTGQTAGESHSFGIRGPALHFPEIRLAFPTLEMPSLMRFRREPEMIFDGGRGPMVGAVQDLGTLPFEAPATAPANSAPANPAPPCMPRCKPSCEAPGYGKSEPHGNSMKARLARLEHLEQEISSLRTSISDEVAESKATQRAAKLENSQSGNGTSKKSSNYSVGDVRGSRPIRRSDLIQTQHQPPVEPPRRKLPTREESEEFQSEDVNVAAADNDDSVVEDRAANAKPKRKLRFWK